MPDREWLKNLADASFVGGSWRTSDPEAIARLTQTRITMALTRLEDEAMAAAELYNDHLTGAKGRRPIRLLRVKDGFAMLCGAAQITLATDQGGLAVTMSVNEGFKRRTEPLMQLSAHVDPFGAVVWSTGSALPMLMTEELVVQRLFEELARASQA